MNSSSPPDACLTSWSRLAGSVTGWLISAPDEMPPGLADAVFTRAVQLAASFSRKKEAQNIELGSRDILAHTCNSLAKVIVGHNQHFSTRAYICLDESCRVHMANLNVHGVFHSGSDMVSCKAC